MLERRLINRSSSYFVIKFFCRLQSLDSIFLSWTQTSTMRGSRFDSVHSPWTAWKSGTHASSNRSSQVVSHLCLKYSYSSHNWCLQHDCWLLAFNFFTASPKVPYGHPGSKETRQGSLQQDLHGQGHQEDLRPPDWQDHQGAARPAGWKPSPLRSYSHTIGPSTWQPH